MRREDFKTLAEWKAEILAWKKRADDRLAFRARASWGDFPRLTTEDVAAYRASIDREFARLRESYRTAYQRANPSKGD